jgi:SAM-dependent methyltransferase
VNKLIKKAALLLPPVKRLYQSNQYKSNHIEELNRQITKLTLTIQNISTNNNYLQNILNVLYPNKRYCPICCNETWEFLPTGITFIRNGACPYCYSVERHRTLWLYMENNTDILEKLSGGGGDTYDYGSINILHFAPEKCFYDKFINIKNCDYYPVDFNPQVWGIRDVVDIQNIKYNDNIFDAIFCTHVLEHIPDDYAAMKELRRVLKPDGVAFINVPIDTSLETTLENPEYNTPELREKYYGQDDHLRMYGKDYPAKLKSAGFAVKAISPNKGYSEKELYRYGLFKDETIFQCTVN